MMKISHFLRSRGALSEKLLPGKVNNNGSAIFTHGITSQSSTSFGRSGNQPVNIFADYTVYKGKGALSMNPIMPKFSLLESGGFRVDKKGVVLLTFLPAIGERKYDWQKRQLFALSATELGSLISLEPGKSCEFFHDPSMKTSNAGQIRKSLSVTPFSDETGYMFNLSVVNGVLKTNERLSVPLTKAEFTVIRTACSDSPVGTGFSYVEGDDATLAVKTDEEAAADLTTLLKALYNTNGSLQQSPLHVAAESYGGKFAVTVGLSSIKAIEAGELNMKLGGVALGDSWISPEDFVYSWGPVLKAVSRIDNSGFRESNRLAQKIKEQLGKGQFEAATDSWEDLEQVISDSSNNVDLYNFMLDYGNDPVVTTTVKKSNTALVDRYSKYLEFMHSSAAEDGLPTLMNGAIKKKLKIIPQNISWGGQNNIVFPAMKADFMKPRIKEVDELLAKGVNVTIYNGQVDVICSTMGAEAWVGKLKWEGLNNFLTLDRTPLYCGGDNSVTKGFMKSYKNLHFYWILGAGHYVPVDQPCLSLEMIGNITQSPSTS